MEASINVTLKISTTEHYTIVLGIPSGVPSKDSPYLFSVKDKEGHELLDLAVGHINTGANGDADSEYHFSISPPKSQLPDTVENLEVKVSQGKYDSKTHKFTSAQ